MRKTLAMATLAALVGAAVLVGCTKSTCPDSASICGSDGKLYCHYLPADLHPLDRACCPDSVTAMASPADAGFQLPFDANFPLFVDAATGGTGGADEADAGEVAADAGTDVDASTEAADAAMAPTSQDAGGCPDADYLDYFHGMMDAGKLPVGRDDGGIPYVYRCNVEICHQPQLGYDAGLQYILAPDAGNCGPLGCQ